MSKNTPFTQRSTVDKFFEDNTERALYKSSGGEWVEIAPKHSWEDIIKVAKEGIGRISRFPVGEKNFLYKEKRPTRISKYINMYDIIQNIEDDELDYLKKTPSECTSLTDAVKNAVDSWQVENEKLFCVTHLTFIFGEDYENL